MSAWQRDYLTGTLNFTPNTPTLGDNNVTVALKSTKTRTNKSSATTSNTSPEKDFPMYIAMAKLVITPTGFENSKIKYAVLAKVEMMCGEVSHSYTDRTTHLLAAHANTTKVEIARERNLPVMTLEWVETLWNACQQNNPYIHASLPQFQSLECPLFYNIRFTLTNHYDDDTRTFYEKLITEYGGSLTMKVSSPCSSFFVCSPNEKGRMISLARANKIICIAHAWIVDSIKIGNLKPTRDYEVEEDCLPNYLPPEIRMGHTFAFTGNEQGGSSQTKRLSVPVVNDLIQLTDESYNSEDSTLTLSETMIDVGNNSTLVLNETLIDLDDDTVIKTDKEEKLNVVPASFDKTVRFISFTNGDGSIHTNARDKAKIPNENDILTSVGG
ncbi:unnamed protein product [Orchesella dallaii]|uniref:BRCT domain-containing protein n=1 Tax=Orchesella dallaii TaxID=48710 RepID=A0ABP1RKP0_9HEXA